VALRVIHTTTYRYSNPVSVSHTEVHLAPRADRNQTLIEHHLAIDPAPESLATRDDYFGNSVSHFSILEPHQTLVIAANSVVDRHAIEAVHPALTPSWEQVALEVGRHESEASFDALEFVYESPRVIVTPAFAAYAAPSFPAGRPLLEAAMDLCHRIFTDFKYDQRATTVSTPIDQVLQKRGGVCQDFAHVMLACVRSRGVPARYVSGYVHLARQSASAQASHAWVSVFCPGFGWLDFDPTNDVMPAARHVTIAWGRDYSDVPPVNGVALGGGDHNISVAVHVLAEDLKSVDGEDAGDAEARPGVP
jgi:transglutaminase-like putative cysteine protease